MASAAAEFKSPDSTPINYILLEGQKSAGYAELLGFSSPRRLRIMAGPGFDGAAVAFAGFLEQHFSVKFHLYDDKDWADWHIFKQLLTKATAKTQSVGGTKVARAMDIWHPFLADPLYNIHAVTVEDVGPYLPGNDQGEWAIEVKFVSTLKPQASFAAIEASKDQPLDARDREIRDNGLKIGKNQSTIEALKNQRLPAPK